MQFRVSSLGRPVFTFDAISLEPVEPIRGAQQQTTAGPPRPQQQLQSTSSANSAGTMAGTPQMKDPMSKSAAAYHPSGSVDPAELLARSARPGGISPHLLEGPCVQLRAAWTAIDVDRNGTVSREEFQKIGALLGI